MSFLSNTGVEVVQHPMNPLRHACHSSRLHDPCAREGVLADVALRNLFHNAFVHVAVFISRKI